MSYIGNEPIVSATRTITETVATAGQTTFTPTGGYTAGFIDVFVNGLKLQNSAFTATDGYTVVLGSAASSGDKIRLEAWGVLAVANINGANITDATVTGAKLASGAAATNLGFTPLNPTTSQTANTVYAAPNGSSGAPSFRTLVAADVPTLNQNTTGTASALANTGGWAVTPSGTKLLFVYNGVTVGSLDSSGNFIAKANVTAYGTP